MKIGSVVLLAAGALLPGCGLFTSPEDDLREARARWDRAGLVNYTFQHTLSCFCGEPANRPLWIEVANGQVVWAYDLSRQEPLESALLSTLPAVPDLFDVAARAIRDADKYDIRYDGGLGYPAAITIDWLRNAVDDEQSFHTGCVRAVLPGAATSDPCTVVPPR